MSEMLFPCKYSTDKLGNCSNSTAIDSNRLQATSCRPMPGVPKTQKNQHDQPIHVYQGWQYTLQKLSTEIKDTMINSSAH